MCERHFAFFHQGNGDWIREWKGPVPEPDIPTSLVGDARIAALNEWATTVSQPQPGEVCLDVTHIGWPVGDFCYCTFDEVDRRLDWGPPRHYIEVKMDTLDIVANQESHRPIRDAVPGQKVFDITGTWLEPFHGNIFGRIVRRGQGWAIVAHPESPKALEETPLGLEIVDGLPIKEAVLIHTSRQSTIEPAAEVTTI